jgi:hypothetical protein
VRRFGRVLGRLLIGALACLFGIGLFVNEARDVDTASACTYVRIGFGETRGVPLRFENLYPGGVRESLFAVRFESDSTANLKLGMRHTGGDRLGGVVDLQVSREVVGRNGARAYQVVVPFRPLSQYYGTWLKLFTVRGRSDDWLNFKLEARMHPDAGLEWQARDERFELTLQAEPGD